MKLNEEKSVEAKIEKATMKRLDKFEDWQSAEQEDEDEKRAERLTKLYDVNTRYNSSIRDRQTLQNGVSTVKQQSKKGTTTLDIRSRSYQNKQSLFSKATRTTSGVSGNHPLSNGNSRNKDK